MFDGQGIDYIKLCQELRNYQKWIRSESKLKSKIDYFASFHSFVSYLVYLYKSNLFIFDYIYF